VKFVEQLKSDEANLFAAGIAWTIGLLWFTIGGFYLGTIFGSKHVIDLQPWNMNSHGLTGIGVGFIVGVCVALFVTVNYPRVTARDAKNAEEHDHH
jgi:uncharacterized membrane protein